VTVPGGGRPQVAPSLPEDPDAPARRRPGLWASLRAEGAKGALIATVSTLVFVAVLTILIVNSPGWPAVEESFFDGDAFRESLPDVLDGFMLNVQMFLIAEAIVLVFALLLAVIRSLPGPVFFPLRAMVVIYTDLFRGIPTLLVILILAFGMPPLDLRGFPRSPVFWSVVALALVYSAYVAEVYRAGIESVHPSQRAAARSLGLSQWQSLRFVVIPQAIRRVIPPLLNDFVGLQKDTALVAIAGPLEAVREAQIYSTSNFNFTSYWAAAILFVLVTIPLARFTDYLIERDRRRRQAEARR
jgi:polar amino acid transport system permease protein